MGVVGNGDRASVPSATSLGVIRRKFEGPGRIRSGVWFRAERQQAKATARCSGRIALVSCRSPTASLIPSDHLSLFAFSGLKIELAFV